MPRSEGPGCFSGRGQRAWVELNLIGVPGVLPVCSCRSTGTNQGITESSKMEAFRGMWEIMAMLGAILGPKDHSY